MGPEYVRSDHEPQHEEEEGTVEGGVMSWFMEGII